ncbi:MAG: CBS domain-containing protein [Nitrospinota bacterium]|nr:CBS domain-containing protein [Nitrospinota bacterium]
MTRKVVTTDPTETLDNALGIMVKRKIAHLPVVSKGALVGIISDRDLRRAQRLNTRKTQPKLKNGAAAKGALMVKDVMTKAVHTASPATPVTDAVHLMLRMGIGALPVLEQKALKGIVTKDDLLGVFLELVRVIESSSTIDVELVDEIDDIESILTVLQKHRAKVLNYSATPRGKSGRQICHFRLRLCPIKPIVRDLKKRGVRVLEAYGEDQ